MSFNDDVQLDTSQVESGGGGRGGPGMVVGGGLGGIILLVIALIFGLNPSDLPGAGVNPQGGGPVEAGGDQSAERFAQCRTGADANRNVECRVIATVNSVQAFWAAELPRHNQEYPPAKTVLYRGATQSGCGTASNQVGPFYCPLDTRIYIDADFFSVLTSQFGADDGALAQMYVVAHEYGHHLQNVLGLLERAQQDPKGPESGAVRVELMADCLAGVWAHHAATTKNAQGQTYLKPLTRADIQSALSAAAAVGDDRIQEKVQGRVNPESWTHGSAAARQKWFLVGYQGGDLNACDTFAVPSVS